METGEPITDGSEEVWCAVYPPGQSVQPDNRTVNLWALVLTSRGVPCRIEKLTTAWQVTVAPEQWERACRELGLYVTENRNWPPQEPVERPLLHNTLVALSVLFLLASFHNLTLLEMPLFKHPPPEWVELGSAKAHLIRYGEIWRLITSLTLHADWLHLFSNLTIGGLFIVSLCREYGSGLAWFLLLAAGSFGNLVNAYSQMPTHSSVGASTAVFGAVGILAGVNLVRRRFQRQRRWMLPAAAALALLALLGTEGKNTDLGAHLYGFLSGLLLGLSAEYFIGKTGMPGRWLNRLLGLISALIVAGAWYAALAYGI